MVGIVAFILGYYVEGAWFTSTGRIVVSVVFIGILFILFADAARDIVKGIPFYRTIMFLAFILAFFIIAMDIVDIMDWILS